MFKKPLLIAEIGGNHQGDFGKAKELVHMALDCDVDFVKLQTYFADTLASKYGWDSETTKKKLIISAILQDIAVPDEAMTKINTLPRLEEEGYEEDQIEKFINHPIAAANYAKQFTTYTDIDYIIENHHELPGRKGFPNRTSGSKFTQITAVFNSAQYIAGEVDGQSIDSTLFSLIQKSITKDYTSAIYREAQRYLKLLLKL